MLPIRPNPPSNSAGPGIRMRAEEVGPGAASITAVPRYYWPLGPVDPAARPYSKAYETEGRNRNRSAKETQQLRLPLGLRVAHGDCSLNHLVSWGPLQTEL